MGTRLLNFPQPELAPMVVGGDTVAGKVTALVISYCSNHLWAAGNLKGGDEYPPTLQLEYVCVGYDGRYQLTPTDMVHWCSIYV